MAKRKSTREAHSSRNRRSHSARPSPAGSPAPASKPSAQSAAPAAIEAARIQLRRACAVLDCTRYVLLYEDQVDGEQRPSFSDAIDVARDLVATVIDALDPVNLWPGKRPALAAVSAHSDSE